MAAFPALARLAAPLFENAKSAPTLHVTLTDTGIDVDISGVERRSGGLSADARVRVAKAAGEADFARVTLDGEGLYQVRDAVVRFGSAAVAPAPGGFLQAVAGAEEAMGRLAVQPVAVRTASPTSTAAQGPSPCGWRRSPRCWRRTSRRALWPP